MPFPALVHQDEKHADCAAPTAMEERRHVVIHLFIYILHSMDLLG
jgi:hypothetical protein